MHPKDFGTQLPQLFQSLLCAQQHATWTRSARRPVPRGYTWACKAVTLPQLAQTDTGTGLKTSKELSLCRSVHSKMHFANCPQKNPRSFLLLVISSSAKKEGSDVIWSTAGRNQAIFLQKQESFFGFFPGKSTTKSIRNQSKGSKMQTRNPEFISSYLCSLF